MTYRARGRSLFEVILVSINDNNRIRCGWFCRSSCAAFCPPEVVVEPARSLIWSSCFSPNVFYNLSPLQLQAICFVCFLVGFITVLCIGNYFRAKRAQERQRQRRLAKLAASNNAAAAQGMYATDGNFGSSSYEAPAHLPSNNGVPA